VTATLYSEIGGVWQSNTYTYTEASSAPATMTSPTPGSVLTGSSVTFTWTAGSGVTEYELRLGTGGAGSSNLYNSETTTARSVAVTGLPTTGATVTATLYSEIGGVWQSNTYTYTEASSAPATMTSPTPGSVLTGSNVTFTWTAGSGVTEYELRLGTTGAGSHDLYNSGTTTATTESVTGLPTTGATVTATLYSLIGSTWESNVYTYTEQ
jgi:serine protease